MPRGNGTGPIGLGPMTGRAAGFCAGYPISGFMNSYGGRRFYGSGRGGGFGRRFTWAAPVVPGYPVHGAPVAYPGVIVPSAAASADVELNVLKAQAEQMKQSLTEISKRIEELEGTKHENVE